MDSIHSRRHEHNSLPIGPLSGEVLDLVLSVSPPPQIVSPAPSYTCCPSAAVLCFFLHGVGIVGKRDEEDKGEDTHPSSSSILKSRDSEEAKAVDPSSTPPTV